MWIGGVGINPPLALAPMAGVTDLPMRIFCKEQGAGLVITEMVSAMATVYENQRSWELLATVERERPLAVQIFGSEPGVMARAVEKIQSQISGSYDLLDINMGCPTPKIVKSGEGSALMKDPARAQAIVQAVVSVSKVPVTVKIRSGWDEVTAPQLAPLLQEAGAQAIAVHARTRSQFYTGKADWSVIREVKKAVTIPVWGNGDVTSGERALVMFEETGCDGVMIGRAAMGNPWIFAEVHAVLQGREKPSPQGLAQRVALGKRQLEMMMELKGERRAVCEMRKHLAWLIRGLPGSGRVKEDLNRAQTGAEVLEILQTYESQA